MPATIDPLTPIHKGIRSIIYSLGSRLQTVDFSDQEAVRALLAELRVDLGAAAEGACMLCMLHAHAGHEEEGLFPHTLPIEPELTRALLADHHEFTDRVRALSLMASEILSIDDPQGRLARGLRLTQEANEFFARYLAHMNREEERLVPALQRSMSDEQMLALIAQVEGKMDPGHLAAMMSWVLPAVNAQELTGMLAGARATAPPPAYQHLLRLAQSKVDPARWKVVEARLNAMPVGAGPGAPPSPTS